MPAFTFFLTPATVLLCLLSYLLATLDNDTPIRFTRHTTSLYNLPVLPPLEPFPRFRKPQLSAPDHLSDDESEAEDHPPFFGTFPRPFQLPPRVALPKQIIPPSLASQSPSPALLSTMASKIIAPFAGPITPSAINDWLSQCENGFAIYAATKSEKSPELDVVTKIRLTGTQLHEPSAAAWWNAGRKEFLKLATWEEFEKQIWKRFMAKGYKLIALCTFFLCSQGRQSFAEYSAALMEARNLAGSTVITPTIYKYQLLFHAHSILLLRIMALPDFDIDVITVDDLISLMSMQWESIIVEASGRSSSRLPASGPSLSTSSTPTPVSLAPSRPFRPLTDEERAERDRLTAAGGCWKCKKTPADPGWINHQRRNCPGDAAKGERRERKYMWYCTVPPIYVNGRSDIYLSRFPDKQTERTLQQVMGPVQYSEGGDIDAHFAALRTAWNNANTQGADIKDAKFRMIVLKSMPVAWAILISTLAHIPTSTAIITHLTLHATLVRAKAGPATSQSAQALSTQSRRNVRNPHLKCDNCGRLGHMGPDCYREGGGKAGQYPEWWKRDKPTTPAMPATVPAANSAVSSTTNPLYLALAATHPTTRSATLVTYADSAASNHFFACRGDFETYGPIPDGTTKGSTANGGDFRMAGTGRVRKNVVHEGRKVQLTFEHAIHTPDLTHNLVSIGCLGARGCSVMFSGNGATFFDRTAQRSCTARPSARCTRYTLRRTSQSHPALPHSSPTLHAPITALRRLRHGTAGSDTSLRPQYSPCCTRT
ncbi:hypothetical protein D9615_009034 [Tricholomella constricta]|uniref:CCHC-type domain-containing protein n=1 Tax=Tricholomella constricta TaxID=117010 RepID=A0A8H5H0L1_9AGAR|nr:hypothetical protein D9615_009034 [Tricholomella constricta]